MPEERGLVTESAEVTIAGEVYLVEEPTLGTMLRIARATSQLPADGQGRILPAFALEYNLTALYTMLCECPGFKKRFPKLERFLELRLGQIQNSDAAAALLAGGGSDADEAVTEEPFRGGRDATGGDLRSRDGLDSGGDAGADGEAGTGVPGGADAGE